MSSIIKANEIQNSSGGADVKIQTLKHPNSSSNNLVLSSTGKVTTADTELNIKTTSHTFTVKGVDSAIGDSQSGTAPDTSDSDSGQFAVYNGSTRLFGITEHGYVLTPKAVWFHAYNGATQDTSLPNVAIEVVEFTSAQQDSSNSYNTSNYTFTAPVSGAYHFSYGMMNNSAEYMRHSFFLNGVEVNERFLLNSTYANSANAMTRSLVAGDSVNVRVNTNSESAGGHVHSDFRVFTGFLIG